MRLGLALFKRNTDEEAPHLTAGRWGEAVAAKYLAQQGYKLLGTRVRVGLRDELDIIARQGETLIFVEVKTRASEQWGRPFDAVDRKKRRILGRAAFRYMKRLRKKPPYFRFDVIEVIGNRDDGEPQIRHIPNAFSLPPEYRVPW